MKNSDNRTAEAVRNTRETQIRVSLDLDGTGKFEISTGLPVLNHMLEVFSRHSLIDLKVAASGDLDVDSHHLVEDIGIVLGGCIDKALGDRRGIRRYGFFLLPMDEALAEVTLDLSGRPWLEWRGDDLLPPLLGGEEKDLWREFYKALATSGRFNLHIEVRYGKNGHHLLESAAKGLGLALAQAVRRRGDAIRSTKGGLD